MKLFLGIALALLAAFGTHWLSVERNLSVTLAKIETADVTLVQKTTALSPASGFSLLGGKGEAAVLDITPRLYEGLVSIDFDIAQGKITLNIQEDVITLSPTHRNCAAVRGDKERYRCRVPVTTQYGKTARVVISAETQNAVVSGLSLVQVNESQPVWHSGYSIPLLLVVFLPLAILIGFVGDMRYRTGLILTGSLLFIAMLSPSLLLFMLAFSGASYGLLTLLAAKKIRLRHYILTLALSIVCIKSVLPGAAILLSYPSVSLLIPIGLTYLIARHIDLAVYMAGQGGRPDLARFINFTLFWPSFAAGPITQLQRMDFTRSRFPLWADRMDGAARFCRGLAKKSVGDFLFNLMVIKNLSFVVLIDDPHPYVILTVLFYNLLFVYLDFSGYSDMAIGAARLMGIALPENFNNPLMKPNLREFWKCWHMSLTQWVSRNVFMPLSMQLRRQPKSVLYALPILATTVTIGMVHGFHFIWLLWGVHHAAGLYVTDACLRLSALVKKRLPPGMLRIYRAFSYAIGVLFVWYWLMLSYSFTLISSVGLATDKYLSFLLAPVRALRILF